MSRQIPQSQDTFEAFVSSYARSGVNHIGAHSHEGFELLYLTEGTNNLVIGGTEYRAVAGDLVVYHPRVVHEEFVQPGVYRIVCLRFAEKNIADNVPFPTQQDMEPVLHLPWRERFHNLFEQLVLENRGIDEWSEALAGTYLVQFAILLWRALRDRGESRVDGTDQVKTMRISHVIELIHNRINPDVALRDLAARAFMSPSYFSHVFKAFTGVPPKRYVIGTKIEKARELLTSTDDSAAAISRALGYESPQYFSRLFRKECGCTPLEYRQRRKTTPRKTE